MLSGKSDARVVGWSSVSALCVFIVRCVVILDAVQRGAISRLLAKINEAEAMMNQVCTCVFVHVCVVWR